MKDPKIAKKSAKDNFKAEKKLAKIAKKSAKKGCKNC